MWQPSGGCEHGSETACYEKPCRYDICMTDDRERLEDILGVDIEEVWAAVVRDLPDLKRKIEVILRELGGLA